MRAGRPRRRPAGTPAAEPEGPRCRVRVLDNAWNTYEQVMRICVVALGCSAEEAYAIAWHIDHEGSAVVLEADRGTAEHVAGIIGTIGIEVRVEPIA
jgi:ATP-dependent Clp protease adapter protein ClpS